MVPPPYIITPKLFLKYLVATRYIEEVVNDITMSIYDPHNFRDAIALSQLYKPTDMDLVDVENSSHKLYQ